ncbi:cell division cycle-associated protein 3 [Pseudochaenichthys georgianus]|uniref:cell division cycle-associated protein 3 n=1 Tax=Pseudochaenichthys georgianus TaxID=52239 RepID=UPI00146C7EAF|nr:cell division cycle-associated protein 3 isoform X1 [Pseudochaenichthys georgianus]
MGSSESKMVVCAPIKPEPAIKNSRVTDLMDPRSPTALDRTPIQVAVSKTECPLAFTDPRSPSIEISRTPAREVMSATVGSFARRLGLLLHNESEGKVPEAPPKCFNDAVEEESCNVEEELASTVPLLSHQPSHTHDSLAEHANLLVTPLQSEGDMSPFVLLQNPQEDVELETETDLSLEEAEEARETPLHKRLSMSLITYHEGETSAQIFADVHCDGASSPRMSADVESLEDNVDHTYDLPTITVEPETPVEPSFAADSEASAAEETDTRAQETEETETRAQETEETETKAQETEAKAQETEETEAKAQETETKAQETEETETKAQETDTRAQETEETDTKAPVAESSSSPPAPEPPSVTRSGIRCPSFDAKSPSQVVFKPQWLGKGFGATGIRARRVHSGKGGSSPLAVRVAVKNANSENKRLSGKLTQKGTEGRSPLQRLKGANSPREQRSQVKLKVSTPDKPRLGALGRGALAVSLDKENR